MAVDTSWLRKALSECVSRDPVRSVLTVVHHDPEGQLVATNGHVLFVVRDSEVRLIEPVPGGDYYPLPLSDGLTRPVVPTKSAQPFPEWRRVIPKDPPKAVFRMILPEWLSKVRANSRYIRPCAVMGGSDPHLRLDGSAAGALVHIDLRYLRTYALGGFPVFFAVRGPTEATIIAGDRESVEAPLKAKWFGAIMPLRSDSIGTGRALEVAK